MTKRELIDTLARMLESVDDDTTVHVVLNDDDSRDGQTALEIGEQCLGDFDCDDDLKPYAVIRFEVSK